MIKEYFTDGLIGLAILLSIFRTDLLSLNLNNLINYPEVQDVLLGQTAAYLPTSFHTIQQTHYSPSLKQLELDNDALNSYYQNVNNFLRFQQGRQNEIEAFLVSASLTTISESLPDLPENHSSSEIPGNENIIQTSSHYNEQSVPEVDVLVVDNENTTVSVSLSNDHTEESDTTSLLNPFPGCNLTREDLNIIEALWKQDVDLGVGKEVYDPSLRQELERERELESLRQIEKQKAQLAAREKEEKARQEQAGRWLRQNFMRDGETGEWVKLHNGSSEGNNDTALVKTEELSNDSHSMTLEAALDYISSGLDPDLFNFESPVAQTDTSYQNLPPYEMIPIPEFQETQEAQHEPQAQMFSTQESLEESLNGLVNYLNMTGNITASSDLAVGGSLPEVTEYKMGMNASMELNMPPQAGQMSVLLQNATMPTPGLDMSNDFNINSVPCELNTSTVQQTTPMNTTIDLGLDNLDFFSELTTLPEGDVDDLDLSGVDFLLNLDNSSNVLDEAMEMPTIFDSLSRMTDNLTDSSVSVTGSPNQDSVDDFAGLEGATGGSNFTTGDFDAPYSKLSRLSESSNDSGIVYHDGFSPSSSSSSYTGSPTGSQHGNGSTSSNDTEHDPHRTGALAHHVAHNHTYNTLPGQIPREVKKYAHKEPSKKGPQSRDHKRILEMKIPFSLPEITESPVETFNEMLTKHKLTDSQLTLIRDIRRRGKNKVAAQNCRKRKVHVIVSLADDTTELEKMRDRLKAEREEMEKETRRMKEKFGYLYTHIFQSLRDERGEPYDPNLYSLQQSSDGNVFLVPRNVTNNRNNTETDDKASRKRKSSGI